VPKTNEELEELFQEWSDLILISGGDPFRARAYEKAARAVGAYPKDVRTLDEKELQKIPNVGSHMARRIREYVETGTMHELEELRELVPPGVRELTRIPGLGPKKAVLLHETLGISSIDQLLEAIAAHRLRDIKGLGPKTEENLLRGIEHLRSHGERIRLDVALSLAEELVAGLAEAPGLEEVTYAGSLRRMCETIGDIDLLAAARRAGPVMDAFGALPLVDRTLARGETKMSVLTRKGIQVDLRVVPPEAWGAALLYFTGSKAHNIKVREMAVKRGWKLSEYGLFDARTGRRIAARTEEEVYERLGLPWIPPTLREDAGEVEAALAGELPRVVEVGDLRGDLHTHTNLTDGQASLEDMLAAAAARGYAYYAVTDHAEKLSMTGMSREKVLAQRRRIAELQRRYPRMTILHGAELNIGPDGEVDYDPEFLAGFDITVASVHSLFNQPRDRMTRRIIAAMENPHVHIIGHPTGRLIGRRAPVDVDLEAVFAAAARTGTALEVDSYPDRLDLRDEHVRWAIGAGATIAISSDAHAVLHLDGIRYGVATAQRGWATKAHVLNARTLRELRAFVAAKRRRAERGRAGQG
jgi:DNA polymerase (family 10)